MNPKCDKPGCGLELVFALSDDNPLRCPRDDDAHALCAKLAESEARVKDLKAELKKMKEKWC